MSKLVKTTITFITLLCVTQFAFADRYPIINPTTNDLYSALTSGDSVKASISLDPSLCEDISTNKSKQAYPIKKIIFDFNNAKMLENNNWESTHTFTPTSGERLQILASIEPRAIFDIDYNSHHYTYSCTISTTQQYKGVTLYNVSATKS